MWFSINRQDTTNLNDVRPVPPVITSQINNCGECDDKKCQVMNEAFGTTEPGFFAISAVVTTSNSPTGHTTDKLLGEQAKDTLCHPLSSAIGTPGSGYAYDHNGFLVCIPEINEKYRSSFGDGYRFNYSTRSTRIISLNLVATPHDAACTTLCKSRYFGLKMSKRILQPWRTAANAGASE